MALVTRTPWRVVVGGGRAHLQTVYDDTLIDAVRAIPGRDYHAETRHWSVGLANDRPRSLLRLIERFSLAVDAPSAAALQLAAAATRATFDLELVRSVRGVAPCVSLCDDWVDQELGALCEKHESCSHPEVGRLSLVLSSESASDLRALWERRDDIRWTPPVARAVNFAVARSRATGTRAGPAGLKGPDALRVARPPRVSVRFDGGGRDLMISTTDCEAVTRAFPEAVRVSRQTLIVPATRSTALGLDRLADLVLSPRVRTWLEAARRWPGELTASAVDGTPQFLVLGEIEEPPETLCRAPASEVEPGRWQLPLDASGHRALVELLADQPQITVDPRVRRCQEILDRQPDATVPPALLTVEEPPHGDPYFAITVLWDESLGADGEGVLGRRPKTGRPDRTGGIELLADPWNATAVEDYAVTRGLGVSQAARELLDRLVGESREAERRVALSRALIGGLAVPTLAGELMPFQAAGVEYALERRHTFIADEQGLGKTVQALAAVEVDGAFPAIVLCPASLKLNWQREAAQWLPHRSVTLLSGRAPISLDGEILILNYDILEAHRESLAGLGAGALILDESHYCKNPKARRTQEAQLLSAALPADVLRLALTGTPLVNRAKELAPQLRILGRLAEFGSATAFERSFGDAGQRDRLHWHLRRSCYLRRLKRDVLTQLPEKRRALVPVTLTNQADYRRAEESFIAWLHEHYRHSEDLSRRLDGAMRAEALVKLNTLRSLVGIGKVGVAVEWIEDFAASREKLVVFAAHRAVQAKLVERFPDAAHILGTDSFAVRDEAVRRFQADESVRLCICSLKAAAHGLTLTAAANVAFIELGWTPAEHDQAEDRCHRIGQDNAVTAWYLLAAGTIDDRMAALIEHKRGIVGSITDGAAQGGGAMVDALLADYLDDRSRPGRAGERGQAGGSGAVSRGRGACT